jgi:hypothetical protein
MNSQDKAWPAPRVPLHTTQLQKGYGLPDQGPTESEYDFRHCIAGSLRDMGKLIEAHEAQNDCRYDSENGGENVITGVMGALAQAMQGTDYHVSGSNQVGCDIAAGHIVRNPRSKMAASTALMMIAMMGAGR